MFFIEDENSFFKQVYLIYFQYTKHLSLYEFYTTSLCFLLNRIMNVKKQYEKIIDTQILRKYFKMMSLIFFKLLTELWESYV